MKRIIALNIGLLLITWLLVGCASSVPKTTTGPAKDDIIENIPEWYLNPPQDPNFYFGTGSATSRDMQVARDKATSAAKLQISTDMEEKFGGLGKMFQEEVGTAEESHYLEQYTQASESVTSQVLTGAHMDESQVMNEGGVYRFYVLYSIPLASSLEALDKRLSQEEELYTRFRASQAWEEMEKEIEAFDAYKEAEGR